MTQTDLLSGGTDTEALEQIRRHGKVAGKHSEKRTAIAIAHGLAYDPHVDGRLKLTPVGRAKLEPGS